MRPSIALREVRREDIPDLFAMYTDPGAMHMAAFSTDDPANAEGFRQRWERLLRNAHLRIRAIEADGQLAGTVSVWPEEGVRCLGYWVDRQWWGRGVATAAVAAFLSSVEPPLQARVVADNLASQRVLERNGFTRIGAERAFAEGRGEDVEEYIYELAVESDR